MHSPVAPHFPGAALPEEVERAVQPGGTTAGEEPIVHGVHHALRRHADRGSASGAPATGEARPS